MSIQLSQDDFDRLAGILRQDGDWLSVRTRIDLMSDFAAPPRALLGTGRTR